ncbi:response regulator [Deinococcus navajonensis]|uniref:Response regulator n=1 Tax=Deinococcus navajonensis TaxID=309884 RepID=A0ABV8XJD0_9DEIO
MHLTDLLLVEDHDADVMLVQEAVASAGVDVAVHVVRDGVEALSFLRQEGMYARCPDVQLVLLDANTPRMNACEVLSELRADDTTRDLPVVVFSSSARLADIHGCLEEGASGYIVKPNDFPGFMAIIHELLMDWQRAVTRSGRHAGRL